MKRNLTLFAVLALLLLSFAVAAYADDEVVLPEINDGRINEFDIDAPVAVYAIWSYPYADDVNMGVLDRLEFWGIDGDGNVVKVMDVSAEQILNAELSDGSAVVASAFSYTLYHEADGSLTIIAPTATDGVAYQFNWVQSF